MHHRSSVAYARIAKALAFLTLSCALATPAAYASKTAPAKKTATASKQQKAPVVRKAVAQKSPASSSR